MSSKRKLSFDSRFSYDSNLDPEGENPYEKMLDKYTEDDAVPSEKEEEKISGATAVNTIIKGIIGFSVLSVPYLFKLVGIIPGIIITLLNEFIGVQAVKYLLISKNITKRYGYSIYAKICFGTMGSFLMKLFALGESIGCCCAYLKIIGESFHSILIIFANLEGTIFNSPKLYSLIAAGIVLLFAFRNNINALSNISYLGNYAVILFMFCLTLLFFNKLFNNQISPISRKMFIHPVSIKDIYVAFSSLLEAFLFQTMTFSIYCSLKKRNNKHMITVTSIGVSFVAIIYTSLGVMAYIMYGENTTESVFGMFRAELIAIKGKNTLFVVILAVALICLLFNAMLSYPLHFFVAKNNIFGILSILKQCNYPNPEAVVEMEEMEMVINESNENKENDENNENENANKEKTTPPLLDGKIQNLYKLSDYSKYIITIVVFSLITLSAITVKELITICNFVGATCANFVCLLAPFSFVIILTKTKWFNTKKLFAKCMVFLGIVVLAMYFFYEVIQSKPEQISGGKNENENNIINYDYSKIPPFDIIYGDYSPEEKNLAQILQTESKKYGVDAELVSIQDSLEKIGKKNLVVFIVTNLARQNLTQGYGKFLEKYDTFTFVEAKANKHFVYGIFGIQENMEKNGQVLDNIKIIDDNLNQHFILKVCDNGLVKKDGNLENNFNAWQKDIFWPKVVSYFNLNSGMYEAIKDKKANDE